MRSHDLKLTGRSGCELEVLARNDAFVVRKNSTKSEYDERLIIQAKKQQTFKNGPVFLSPAVSAISDKKGSTYFEMEYVSGEKYSEHFSRVSKAELDHLIDHLIGFIKNNLSESSEKLPDPAVFVEKAKALQKTLANNKFALAILEQLIAKVPDSPLPHGYCHGDLTFSNMIFSGEKVYFVDFLDSFVDSPIIDVVKLRQDTRFYWTVLIDTELEAHRKNKMFQVMNYFDRRIELAFAEDQRFVKWYDYLQAFNLVRILPYIHSEAENELVTNALKTIKL